MPVRNRPQRLKKIKFLKLKNLENLEISFENNHITGIFGTNGSGKSTVLHALACLYQPVTDSVRKNFKFPNFFIPTTLDLWNGSQFTIEYEMINGTEMIPERKEYRKKKIDGILGIKQDHIEKFFILELTVVFLKWR